MSTPKFTLIETQSVERDYGFTGTRAIIDTTEHGRLLIEDGFGGMDSLSGGCVRWRHGCAYRLKPGDSFETLEEESNFESCGDTLTNLDVVIQQADESRPWLDWSGHAIAAIAESLDL